MTSEGADGAVFWTGLRPFSRAAEHFFKVDDGLTNVKAPLSAHPPRTSEILAVGRWPLTEVTCR